MTYSCSAPVSNVGDICNFNVGRTTTSFDSQRGSFVFASEDNEVFGSQMVTITIRLDSGAA